MKWNDIQIIKLIEQEGFGKESFDGVKMLLELGDDGPDALEKLVLDEAKKRRDELKQERKNNERRNAEIDKELETDV